MSAGRTLVAPALMAIVMRESLDRVDVILDQAFGEALRARQGGLDAVHGPQWQALRDAASLRPNRF